MSERCRPGGPADPSRRALFKAAGAMGLSVAMPRIAESSDPRPSRDEPASYTFLTRSEATFIEPAVARLIPSDARQPGAREADVPTYIDRALAGPWGQGAAMYRSGPWPRGLPGQGYQLKSTPAELYRTAIAAIHRVLDKAGTPFAGMGTAEQDALLQSLEKGSLDLDGVPSEVFFDQLLQNTIEGFFSDPMYGGNKNAAGWKAVGFPGAVASWYDLVDQHGIDLSARQRNPVGIMQAGHEHR